MSSTMVAEPQLLSVFARLPDGLRYDRKHSDWGLRHHQRSSVGSFLEAPLVTEDGDLLVVDVAWGRVFRVDALGRFECLIEYPGNPNGIALDPSSGQAFIADFKLGLLTATYKGGTLTIVDSTSDGPGNTGFLGLNDVTLLGDGGLFLTDQGLTGLHDPSGRILHRSASGIFSNVVTGIPSPNGLAFNADRHELLVAVTRDNAVWRVPMDDTLQAFKVGRYIQLSGGIGPDGLAFSTHGWLLVAHLGLGLVRVFDHLGRPSGLFEAPEGLWTTSVAVVPGEDRFYVTEAETGSILVGSLSTLFAAKEDL